MSRFVEGESRKIDLSDGDWILVKKRLTAGERHEVFLRCYVLADVVVGGVVVNREYVAHQAKLPYEKLAAYLLDWSLRDADGRAMIIREKPIEDVKAMLGALDPIDYDEIRDAVDAHEQAMVAEREAQKKTRPGATASSPTSVSPSAAAGALTT